MLKKKIKDLTFGELKSFCDKDKIQCEKCPFKEDEFCPLYPKAFLEREMKVDE